MHTQHVMFQASVLNTRAVIRCVCPGNVHYFDIDVLNLKPVSYGKSFLKTKINLFSHRKQITRQHSCHKEMVRARRVVDFVKMFLSSSLIAHVKFD